MLGLKAWQQKALGYLTGTILVIFGVTDLLLPGPPAVSILIWIWALTVWLIGFLLIVAWLKEED